MNADTTPTDRRQEVEEPPVKCGLGRTLGDCSLRRAGCGSRSDVLRTVYPPTAVLAELRSHQDLDSSVARWLRQLESITEDNMRESAEVIFHHRDHDDDNANKVRQMDDCGKWTVKSYEARTTKAMINAGARQLPNRIQGRMFEVDARQLTEFIAASSGLVVEFRNLKRQTLSPEKANARRLRMAAINAAQRAKI